jgi:CDP-diacylglycerol pyrophosphatase
MIDLLVSPTAKIQGLESEELRSAEAPNLWLCAWKERNRLNALTGQHLSSNRIIMAVNSKATRSQDQLHLHLACVKRDVRGFFELQAIPQTGTWSSVHIDTLNANFFVKRLPADGLKQNVFRIVLNELPAPFQSRDQQLVAVVASSNKNSNGFILLVSFDSTSAENLMDHTCQE